MTPDQRALLLESFAAGVSVKDALRGAGLTARAFDRARAADAELDEAAKQAERAALPPAWAAAVAVSEAQEAPARGVALADLARGMSTGTITREDVGRALGGIANVRDPKPETEDGAAAGLDLEMIEREAARYAVGPFGFLLWVDAQCQRANMPAMSPWWRWSIGEFYASGKQWGIFLVGRGGGKSTTLERVAASDSLFTPRRVPNGQAWTWPFISVGPKDANRRITGILAVLRALGLPIVGDGDSEGKKIKRGEGVNVTRAPRMAMELLDARGNAIELESIAGTIGNVSGPSTNGMTIDEAAKLLDKETGANPLTEIIASGSQTSRARPGWRAIASSSAWERSGAHWQLVEAGDNATNYVARIGDHFIDETLRGFESVAAWEDARGRSQEAAIIRAHMRTLTGASPMVPTWLANPTLGNPDAMPWDGAALASRMLVEVIPAGSDKLEGLTHAAFWLRENGSVPLDRGGAGDGSQIVGLAKVNADLVRDVSRAWAQHGEPRQHGQHRTPDLGGGFSGGWSGGGGTL